jgi:hypothetical protein
MKWLEIISLRSLSDNQEQIKEQLHELLLDVMNHESRASLTIYSRVLIDSDFNIHLQHEGEEIETKGSSLGIYIASLLKKFGLVNHSVWVQES